MAMKDQNMNLKEMEEIAKDAIFRSLISYPDKFKYDQDDWTIGKFLTDDKGIFEIYVPNDRATDARVISRATVDRKTGEVDVETFF